MRAAFLFVLLVGCQSAAGVGATCTRGSDCATGTCEFGRCRAGCRENRDCPTGAHCLLDASGIGACSLDEDLGCESGVGRECPSGLVCAADRCERACTSESECPSDAECRPVGAAMICVDTRGSDGGVPDDAGAIDAAQTDAGADAGPSCAMKSVCFQRMGAACALDCMGRVWCWGDQHGGRLGTGLVVDGSQPIPQRVVDGAHHDLVDVDSLACADGFACVHVDGGSTSSHAGHVMCWGYEPSGAIGDTTQYAASDLRMPIAFASAEVAASGAHACVLDHGVGGVLCFGRNDGTIDPAQPDDTLFMLPTAPPTSLPPVSQLGVAAYGACAITMTNEVRCWGVNEYGEAGHVPIEAVAGAFDPNVPVTTVMRDAATPVTNARALAVGFEQRAVIVDTSTLLTWGGNEANELGEPSTWMGDPCDDQSGFGAVCRAYAAAPLGAVPFESIASAGESRNTCGVRAADHQVLCWGNNLFAHDGVPGGGNEWLSLELEVLVEGAPMDTPLDDVRNVFVGAANACAIRNDGSLWCWGPNQDAQLARPIDGGEHLAVPITIPFP